GVAGVRDPRRLTNQRDHRPRPSDQSAARHRLDADQDTPRQTAQASRRPRRRPATPRRSGRRPGGSATYTAPDHTDFSLQLITDCRDRIFVKLGLFRRVAVKYGHTMTGADHFRQIVPTMRTRTLG